MKTEEELRKMMKDKRYSGSINERDPEFIREVENGFKALFPLREYHLEKVPLEIVSEYEVRTAQVKNCAAAIEETKIQIANLEKQTDKLEQNGNLKKLREHLLLLESNKLYLDILHGRRAVISKLSDKANEQYREAVEQSHDCYACKWLVVEHNQTKCNFGYDMGRLAKPTIEIDKCPDPSGKMFDQDRPIIRRDSKELPSHGLG